MICELQLSFHFKTITWELALYYFIIHCNYFLLISFSTLSESSNYLIKNYKDLTTIITHLKIIFITTFLNSLKYWNLLNFSCNSYGIYSFEVVSENFLLIVIRKPFAKRQLINPESKSWWTVYSGWNVNCPYIKTGQRFFLNITYSKFSLDILSFVLCLFLFGLVLFLNYQINAQLFRNKRSSVLKQALASFKQN